MHIYRYITGLRGRKGPHNPIYRIRTIRSVVEALPLQCFPFYIILWYVYDFETCTVQCDLRRCPQ